jgi:hypothetical protein
MPEPRSSSAVRNLRSLFENKAAANDLDDHNSRGRSPNSRLSLSDPASRPLSKVRASFVDVQYPTRTISNHSSPAMSANNDSPPAASNNSPPDMSGSPVPTLPAAAHSKRASAFEVRTESFSTAALSKDAVSALKQEVHEEQERRQSNPDLFAAALGDEAAVESTTNTPAVEPREDQAMGVIDHAAAKLTAAELPPPIEEEEAETHSAEETADEKISADENEPPANPDKPTTGAEEEKGALKPAMPINEDAVSGGQGLPPVAEDLRPQNKGAENAPRKTEQTQQATATPKSVSDVKSTQKRPAMSPRNSHKPEPVSTGSPKKASEGSLKSPSALKSPAKERKSSSSSSSKATLSPTSAPKSGVVRKASRSSLVAPTAASAARERRESTVKPSVPAVKRETTKPANLPSHLTAPTAASRARQEAESSKPATARPSVAARAPPKQQISTNRPAARSSTATRPESRSTQQSAPRKPTTTAAPTESFLERMMRPTAASASKTHDKPAEPKGIPQRTKSSSSKPIASKTNGTAKPAAKSGSTSKPLHPTKSTEEKPVDAEKKVEEKLETNGKHEETEMPDIPIPATENGTSTPQQGTENGQPAGAALESTPAFGEDQIR